MIPKKRYKVLIIAGGGVFGAIPAHFLASLPQHQQHLNDVDLIAGCSIGGILTACYASGHAFDYTYEKLIELMPQFFDKRFVARLNPLAVPTYDSDSVKRALHKVLGSKTVASVRDTYPDLDMIIPALNITDDSYKVFDNITPQDANVKLATIAQMTSAAPSYYSGVSHDSKCYVDGGLIEVAPLLTATTALKAKRKVPFSKMDVLMIGTGREQQDKPLTAKRYNDLSLLGLATEVIVPYVTLSNEMATRYWGSNIGYGSFTYYNPCTNNGVMDDTDQVPLVIEQAKEHEADFASVWNKWIGC